MSVFLILGAPGLRAEDLVMEELPGVNEAIRRMSDEYQDERYFRFKRGTLQPGVVGGGVSGSLVHLGCSHDGLGQADSLAGGTPHEA